MEIFSKLSIGDLRCTFSPLSKTRWQPCYLCILDKRFHVMEGVEGILIGVSVLLEAIELGPMSEPVFVVSRETFPLELTSFLEVSSLSGVALESVTENTLYSVVVFLNARTPRVEISGNGLPRA